VYYTLHMSMGKHVRERQPEMWVATTDFPTAASHPFYTRLNQRLAEHHFDDFVEGQYQPFYAEIMGRPGLPPGMYFRRGIAWRAADSFALRDFLGVGIRSQLGYKNPTMASTGVTRWSSILDVLGYRR